MAHDGSIRYYDCDLSSPFWVIERGSIIVGKKQVDVRNIIFDTTSQFIRGPMKSVKMLYERNGIKIKKSDTELGLYEIACDTKVSIHLLLLDDVEPAWTIEASV